MGKSKTTTQTTAADRATQQQQQSLYRYANQQAQQGAPGVDPYSQQAAQIYQQGAGATGVGLGALSGNQAAVAQLMNPYQSQVMDSMNAQYDLQRRQNMNDVASQATSAGAFGGSRYGVALGQAMANTNIAQNAQQAQLLQGGYSDAMNRAGQLANFGMGAAGKMADMGDYQRNVQLQQQGYGADTLRENMYKTGTTQTNVSKGNAMSTLGGIASLGMGLFGGPIGAAAGGVLGKMLGGGGGGGGTGGFMSQFNPPQSVFGGMNLGMRP